jgi:hypothetical protein
MSIASISSEMTDDEIAVMASEESGSSPAMTDSKPPAPMAPKVGDTASGNKGKVSASPAEAAPARAERRPRGESGSAGLQSRAAEFREMATDFREQAKSESGHRAENLEARADRADAAADRMESAAGRAGGGAEPTASDGGDSGVAKTDRSTDGGSSTPASGASSPPAKSTPESTVSPPPPPPDVDDIEAIVAQDLASRPSVAETVKKVDSPDNSGVVSALNMASSGFWKPTKIGNNVDAMLWDPTSPSGKSQSNYKAPGSGQSLSFNYSPSNAGRHLITVTGGRIDSAVNDAEKGGHKGIKDKGNDVFVQVRDLDTGQLALSPQKLLIRVNDRGGQLLSGNEFSRGHSISPAFVDLQAGGNYQVEFIGRSDGFAIASASLDPK